MWKEYPVLRGTLTRSVLLLSLGVLTGVGRPSSAQSVTEAPGLHAAARVVREANGMPHVFARNDHDVFFLQGWLHAEDRFFQMDSTRRLASGTLAELLGPGALGSDVQVRTIGLRRAAARSLPLLSERGRAALEAYSEGVNAFVSSHSLPPEYGLLEISRVEPWTPVDALVVSKAFGFLLNFELDIDPTLVLLQYQATGEALGFDGVALYFEDLFRSAPFHAASTVPDALKAPPAGTVKPVVERARRALSRIRPETVRLARECRERLRRTPLLRRALESSERSLGSNVWVVSGEHTEGGAPILANDPHLMPGAPSATYPMHLRARDLDSAGHSVPGGPLVVYGNNRRVAWGLTTNPMDVTDTFEETVVTDPDSPSGLSTVHEGELEAIVPLPEEFRFNQIGDGMPDTLATAPPGSTVDGVFIPPATLIVPRRNNGPLLALDVAGGTALSVQYAGFSGDRIFDALLAFNAAGDLEEFVRGIALFDDVSSNVAYADIQGHIAYFATGELPLREDLETETVNGLPPFFIRNGTGGNEWLPVSHPQPGQVLPFEILPLDEMPHVVDPPAGFLGNSNNDPLGNTLDNDPLNQLRPGGGILYLNDEYFSIRAGRVAEMLEERLGTGSGKVTFEDMQAMQADTVMLDAQVFVPFLLDAFVHGQDEDATATLADLAADPRVIEAAGRLSEWDFTTPTGIAEGFDASDVNGQRFVPTDDEVAASVAATIYSVWRSQIIANTVDAVVDSLGLPRPGSRQSLSALRHLLDNFDQSQGIGASGLDFFEVSGVAQASDRRDILLLRSLADALDLLAGEAFAAAFDHSADQGDYRWGRLHRVVFEHTLGGPFDIPPAVGAVPPPLLDLTGFPTDGGLEVVDASGHEARAASADAFRFGQEATTDFFPAVPAQRFVAEASRRGVRSETSLPGGVSGVPGSPHYADLLVDWLTNESFPLLTSPADILKAAESDERFVPDDSQSH